jgi:hypothetical protein
MKRKHHPNKNHMIEMPKDVLVLISRYLSHKDLINLFSTSSYVRKCLFNEPFKTFVLRYNLSVDSIKVFLLHSYGVKKVVVADDSLLDFLSCVLRNLHTTFLLKKSLYSSVFFEKYINKRSIVVIQD